MFQERYYLPKHMMSLVPLNILIKETEYLKRIMRWGILVKERFALRLPLLTFIIIGAGIIPDVLAN